MSSVHTSLFALSQELGIAQYLVQPDNDVALQPKLYPSTLETVVSCLCRRSLSDTQYTWLLAVIQALAQCEQQMKAYGSAVRMLLQGATDAPAPDRVLGEALARVCTRAGVDAATYVGMYLLYKRRDGILLAWLVHSDANVTHEVFSRTLSLEELFCSPPVRRADQACLLIGLILARAYQPSRVLSHLVDRLQGKWQIHWQAHLAENALTRWTSLVADTHILVEQLYDRAYCRTAHDRCTLLDLDRLFSPSQPPHTSCWRLDQDLVMRILCLRDEMLFRLSPCAVAGWGVHIRDILLQHSGDIRKFDMWAFTIGFKLIGAKRVESVSACVWKTLEVLAPHTDQIALNCLFGEWVRSALHRRPSSNSFTRDMVQRIVACGYDARALLWTAYKKYNTDFNSWLSVSSMSWDNMLAAKPCNDLLPDAFTAWKQGALVHVDAWLGRDVTTLVAIYLSL
jgi:hypothetical protein